MNKAHYLSKGRLTAVINDNLGTREFFLEQAEIEAMRHYKITEPEPGVKYYRINRKERSDNPFNLLEICARRAIKDRMLIPDTENAFNEQLVFMYQQQIPEEYILDLERYWYHRTRLEQYTEDLSLELYAAKELQAVIDELL